MTDKEFNAFKALMTKVIIANAHAKESGISGLFEAIASRLITSENSDIKIMTIRDKYQVTATGEIKLPCGNYDSFVVFKNKGDESGYYDRSEARDLYSKIVKYNLNSVYADTDSLKKGLPENVEIAYIGFMPVEKENQEEEND